MYSAIIAALVLGALYIVSLAAYNLYLHPLRKYPGPVVFAALQLPILFHRSRGDAIRRIAELHAEYGPVVRIGPNELSFIEAQAWKDIHGRRAADHGGFEKDLFQYGIDLGGDKPSFLRSGDARHAEQRRMFSHAFSDKALRDQESLIKGYVEKLVERLRETAKLQSEFSTSSFRLDIVKMYNFVTFDIMSDLTYGESFGMLDNGEYVPWVEAVPSFSRLFVFLGLFGKWRRLALFVAFIWFKDLKDQHKLHAKYVYDLVDKRMERTEDRGDIWSQVSRYEDIKQLARKEMYSISSLFMIAGTETTASLLSGLTFLLCTNPDKMKKLSDEIRALDSPAELNMLEVRRLPYLQATVDEALRMYPPIARQLPRIASKGGGFACGQFLPEGTQVGIPMAAAFRSPLNFADPDSFVPERWFPDRPEKFSSDQRDVCKPFSYGPRDCLGKNLASHEIRLIIASIIWHFDISLEDGQEDWMDQDIYWLWTKSPLHVRLSPVVH